MKPFALKKALLGLLLACLSTGFVAAQSMSFTVSTKNTSGSASSKTIFALWITTSTGAYVKTINRQSKDHTSELTTWCSNSMTKTTDGMTGATLPTHNYAYTNTTKTTLRIPFTWNFKNFSNVLVADGNYYINIEFKEEGKANQLVKYPLTKGASSYTIVPTPVSANSCYTNPSLTYTAPTVALTTTEVTNFDFTYTPSDRNLQLQYDAANHTGIDLQLVNLKGQTVYRTALKGLGKETTQLPACPQGLYLIRLTDKEGWSQTRKLLL